MIILTEIVMKSAYASLKGRYAIWPEPDKHEDNINGRYWRDFCNLKNIMETDDIISKEGKDMTLSALYTENFNIYCKEEGLLIPQDRCVNYQTQKGHSCFWCGYYSGE
ncbi:MAG: hypothetical protein L7F77_01685 [Candidatus Magnetominusculus sp. LBB02]|nr:hypothetical protein [Candidatus Magnetominusculus sp. LBB02]